MKKLLTVIFILLIASIGTLCAQTQPQVNSLVLIAKTWGLLKYYHPGIAIGKQDWDSVLIVSLKQVLQYRKPNAAQAEINRMLTIAGQDTASEYKAACKEPICYRNYDISWINKSPLLDPEQEKALKFIAAHPYAGINYYAQANPGNDSTVVALNEKLYPKMLLPDVNYRLLCLFRFWNVINYYYPYKYAIGKPWDQVLAELIPQFIKAGNILSYNQSLLRMAASINDSHCGLWPMQAYDTLMGKYNVPFNFRLIDNKAVVTKIADSAVAASGAIRMGSVIEAMDGVLIKNKIKQYWGYISASNEGGKIKSMHQLIFRSKKKTALLSGYQQDGKRFAVRVPLRERNFLKEYTQFFETESPVTFKLIGDSIGYVFFSNITDKNMDSVIAPLMHTKAIIFDMRNYPANGYPTYVVPGYFLSKPTLYARDTRPDYRMPGMMVYRNSNQGTDFAFVGKNNPRPYQGKVILLVDERTQSAAEWACMTLQTASDVTVIGRQTAGADGNVTGIPLLGGYSIYFSGLGIYYPDGRETQRVGIRVDIPIDYTIQDIISQNDPVLKKSLEYIDSKNN